LTEYDNLIVNEIKAKETLIDEMLVKIYKKKNIITASSRPMEKMLDAMNSQSMWLTQQFSNYY